MNTTPYTFPHPQISSSDLGPTAQPPAIVPVPDPKNAAGQTDITQHVNPKVAALIAKALGRNKRWK